MVYDEISFYLVRFHKIIFENIEKTVITIKFLGL